MKSFIYLLYLPIKKKNTIFLNSSNFVKFKGKCSHFHVLFLFAKNRFSSLFFLSLILSFPNSSIAQRHTVALLWWHAGGASLLSRAALWGFLPSHPCHFFIILLVLWCGVYCATTSSFSCIVPLVLVVRLSCSLLPHLPPTYSLWHLFRLIAWLACVFLLSWMDWFCLLVTKSKSRVIWKMRWSKHGPDLSNQIAEDFSPNPRYHQIY